MSVTQEDRMRGAPGRWQEGSGTAGNRPMPGPREGTLHETASEPGLQEQLKVLTKQYQPCTLGSRFRVSAHPLKHLGLHKVSLLQALLTAQKTRHTEPPSSLAVLNQA